jgi:FkbM family methyltransferase
MALSSINNNKDWEPHITKFVSIYNEFFDIKNIIDVGANFGYHSLLFSKEVENKGQVFCFEPQPQNYKLLKNNVELNKIKNLVLFNKACSDEEGVVKMQIIDCNNFINMGDFTPNITDLSYALIDSLIIDSLNLPKIDLIKIDVQGWEIKVLNGMKKLCMLNEPVLIVEFEDYQLQKLNSVSLDLCHTLQNMDYYIFYLEYDYPSDHVCVHKNKLDEFRIKFKNYIQPHLTNNEVNNNLNFISEKLVL